MANRASFSNIYPHLAVFNGQNECGIGAAVEWAGRLWITTYGAHYTGGSNDKLYEIDSDLNRKARPESVGGTHACRFIHAESNQLFIGCYAIDTKGGVRVIPRDEMPGRLTAVLRHLTDPENKVCFLSMEGSLYEVDVRSLKVTKLQGDHAAIGSHAKGGTTGQGRMVISNNGEWGWHERWNADHDYDGPTGALAEWDRNRWKVVERKQFCEVGGPGDLSGTSDPEAPVWATGWDERSAILKLLDAGAWHTFRLPKASWTYDGGHGWYTEWPRIRRAGPGKWLMTVHGMFYAFPPGFRAGRTGGIVPVATYLKMVVDFCKFGDRFVLACNDASVFDNPLLGQPQSNLWIGRTSGLLGFGAPSGAGGVWRSQDLKAGEVSDPMFAAGFRRRVLHVANGGGSPATFEVEIDVTGNGKWRMARLMRVPARGYAYRVFRPGLRANWIRIRAPRGGQAVTAWFDLSNPYRGADARRFRALADARRPGPWIAGVARPRGKPYRSLHLLAGTAGAPGEAVAGGYYEIGEDLKLVRRKHPETEQWLRKSARVPDGEFALDAASVIVKDLRGDRYRLPRSHPAYDETWTPVRSRCVREVVTERALMNCHGTFYELPRPSAGGVRRLRPVSTHGKRIADFCSWRGMLVLVGGRPGAKPDGHWVPSDDGKAGIWLGNADDLWAMGKPKGYGGPWRESEVRAGVPSDPYLMYGYDRKEVKLFHDSPSAVTMTIEVDFAADGTWHEYAAVAVPAGRTFAHRFPDGYVAHWVRLKADRDCVATAEFRYD